MPVKVRVGGVWQNIVTCKVFVSGAWRHALAVKIRSGSTWRRVTFPSSGDDMAVSISPSPFAFGDNHETSGTLTATPTGAVAPYSYAWSIIASGGFGSVKMGASSSASAFVQASGLSVGQTATATLRCAVTDDLGNTASADVSGTLTNS